MPEFFDVIDENDKVIDSKLGKECIKLGLLHRAIVVFLYDSRGDVYIQRRADDMPYYPGFWSASCTGHVSSGETYLQAAKREAKEELGLNLQPIEVGRFPSPRWKVPHRTEWELIAVFDAITRGGNITLSDESQDGRFVSIDEFGHLVESDPPVLTPDTLLSVRYSPRLTKPTS